MARRLRALRQRRRRSGIEMTAAAPAAAAEAGAFEAGWRCRRGRLRGGGGGPTGRCGRRGRDGRGRPRRGSAPGARTLALASAWRRRRGIADVSAGARTRGLDGRRDDGRRDGRRGPGTFLRLSAAAAANITPNAMRAATARIRTLRVTAISRPSSVSGPLGGMHSRLAFALLARMSKRKTSPIVARLRDPHLDACPAAAAGDCETAARARPSGGPWAVAPATTVQPLRQRTSTVASPGIFENVSFET